MLIVLVYAEVKRECVEAFKAATTINARASRAEPGIARFDVLQQEEDPTQFVLVEAYRDSDAPAAHKETHHYRAWREAVAPMMVKPRHSLKYRNIDPNDAEY